jgi:hypothetical protein
LLTQFSKHFESNKMCLNYKAIGTPGKLLAALLLLLFLHWSLQAGPVRISFLTDKKALQDTQELLKKGGCGGDSIAAFGKSVEEYNSKGLKFDISHFPQAESGFYSFSSVSQLLSILPSRLWECPHPFDLNCFDTVIVLGSGKFRTDLGPDDHFDEFLPAGIRENGRLEYAHAQTAREAFNLSNPAWYQAITSNDIPSSLTDTRIVLTAAMYCFHTLPASTGPQDVENQVMKTLRESWKKQKVIFPSGFQVVLKHVVDLPSHLFATLHAGLLFPEPNGYTYLEKDGGQGPFVRLDFQDRADLLTWLGNGYNKSDGKYFFATFNGSEIAPVQVEP